MTGAVLLETDLLSCRSDMTVVPPKGTSICHGNDTRARSMRTALDNTGFPFVVVWVKYAYWVIGVYGR